MILYRYEVRASYKDDDNFLSDYTPMFIMKRNAKDWAGDLNFRHKIMYDHSDITYYVYDRKLKERIE